MKCLSRIAGILLLAAAVAPAQDNQPPPGYHAVRRTLSGKANQPEVPYLVLAPASRPKSPRPLLIYLYGAGGSLDFYNLGSGPYTEMRKLLADRGYYILVPGLGPMHWMNREARAKLDRVVDRVLADYPIQRKRVFLMGASMGGGSSLAYAIHRPKLIRAACSHMGMTDFRQWYQDEPRRQKQLAETFGGTPDTAPAAFAEVSAMANIRVFRKIPLFLVYAADDKVVLPAHGRQLYDAVRKQGGTAILRIAPGVAHKNESIMPYQQEIMEFFDRAR